MGRRRLNQVVEGRQLGGHHRLLLLQDVLQAGVGQGPVRGVRRGKGGGGGGDDRAPREGVRFRPPVAGGCHWRPPDGCELSAAPCCV